MKTIDAGLLADYASGAHTNAYLLKLTRKDGTVFGFTDHDEAITYAGLTYEKSSVFDASAVATRGDMNVDNLEAAGILNSAGITDTDIEHGKWDGAKIEVRRCNYKDLTHVPEIIRVGDVGQIKRGQGRYTAEMRGLMQYLQNSVIKVVTPACNADLGDARCGINIETYRLSGTVLSVVSNSKFEVMHSRGDGYFNFGIISFTTGQNAGLSMEVKSYLDTGVLETFLPMPYTVTATDAFTIVPGCNKIHAKKAGPPNMITGLPTVVWYGDCKDKFANVLRFRGFPAVPGPDKVTLFGGQG